MIKEVRVPNIGDFESVEVIEVNVKPGDEIHQEESMAVIESNKAIMELPSPFTGIVKKVDVKIGDRVSEGSLLLTMMTKEKEQDHKKEPEKKSENILAIEKNVFPTEEKPLKKQSEKEIHPLSRLKKIANKRLAHSWKTLVHVTQFAKADVTELEKLRQKMNHAAMKNKTHLTFMPYIINAVVQALKKYPMFNASLDDLEENIIYKKAINIGIAINSKDGLVVPVLYDADKKDIIELSQSLATLKEKAIKRRFKSQDMEGGTFTITNLGKVNVGHFTPIIYSPQAAILGISQAELQPTYVDNNIEPRLFLPLSLSYDHRIIDGVLAAEFIAFVKEILEKVEL